MTDAQAELRARSRELDLRDPLRALRERFHIPRTADGNEQLYFCGHSLGLQPREVEAALAEEMEAWRELAVAGHFAGPRPWMPYHETVREPLAALVGARPDEVVAMNSLTVNLHLLMVSFYRPRGERRCILVEPQVFPSDRYAIASQLRWHGLDPAACLLEAPADANGIVDEAGLEDLLRRQGDRVALVLWPGVQYATGQRFDLGRITRAAHAAGATVGFDLAHAVGNVPLTLHDDGADFAVWCSYKYLNAGPGAVAGAFVHDRHHDRADLTRLEGWWGADPVTRFRMAPDFAPAPGADAWQLSNPPILALAPLRVSLAPFHETGMARLREKSVALTDWLDHCLRQLCGSGVAVVTPAKPARRGCQLSLRIDGGRDRGRAVHRHLERRGIVTDWREPDLLRVAPVPLYNRFEDVRRLAAALRAALAETGAASP